VQKSRIICIFCICGGAGQAKARGCFGYKVRKGNGSLQSGRVFFYGKIY